MAKQLLKKFIADKQVDGEKIKLLAGQSIKAESVSGTEVDLLSVDSTGKVFAMGSEVGKKSEIDQVVSDLASEVTRATGVEAGLQAFADSIDVALGGEIAAREAGDAGLQAAIDQEIIDRVAGDDTTLSSAISYTDGEVVYLEGLVSQEASDRTAADASLQSQIDALSGSSGSSLAAIEAALTQEIADRIADVNAEETRAMAAESVLTSAISQEVSDRQSAVSGLQTQINNVLSNVDGAALDSLTEIVSAFQAADASLNGAITALSTGLSADISAEETARIAADSALQGEIDAEETARAAADTTLQNNIDNLDGYAQDIRADLDQEVIDRVAAVSAEQTARQNADSALDVRIDVLESVVWFKEKFSISNGQTSVTLSHTPEANSVSAFVDRLAIHQGASEDYTISGSTMTFLNDLVSPGQSSLGNGDTVYVKYQYKV